MHLTGLADYSLRTLIYLGRQDGCLAFIADVAHAYRIKESHLSKVVAHLARICLIEAVREQVSFNAADKAMLAPWMISR